MHEHDRFRTNYPIHQYVPGTVPSKHLHVFDESLCDSYTDLKPIHVSDDSSEIAVSTRLFLRGRKRSSGLKFGRCLFRPFLGQGLPKVNFESIDISLLETAFRRQLTIGLPKQVNVVTKDLPYDHANCRVTDRILSTVFAYSNYCY